MPHIFKPYLEVFFLKLLSSSKNYIFILNQTFLIALRKNCWITSHSPVYPLWLAWTNHTGPRPSRGQIEPMSAGHALCSWTALVGFWQVESCLYSLFVQVLHTFSVLSVVVLCLGTFTPTMRRKAYLLGLLAVLLVSCKYILCFCTFFFASGGFCKPHAQLI